MQPHFSGVLLSTTTTLAETWHNFHTTFLSRGQLTDASDRVTETAVREALDRNARVLTCSVSGALNIHQFRNRVQALKDIEGPPFSSEARRTNHEALARRDGAGSTGSRVKP
jgi:hypothetical protein